MKIMTTWSLKPGEFSEAVRRFLAGQGMPPEGVKLLGRWHSADLNSGFGLVETNDPILIYRFLATWADVLEFKNHIVIEDTEAGAALASLGKK